MKNLLSTAVLLVGLSLSGCGFDNVFPEKEAIELECRFGIGESIDTQSNMAILRCGDPKFTILCIADTYIKLGNQHSCVNAERQRFIFTENAS